MSKTNEQIAYGFISGIFVGVTIGIFIMMVMR